MKYNPKVIHLPEAKAFIKGLSEKEANKVQINIRKTEAGLKGEWFRDMPGTKGIFEFRTLFRNKKIRILAFAPRLANNHQEDLFSPSCTFPLQLDLVWLYRLRNVRAAL